MGQQWVNIWARFDCKIRTDCVSERSREQDKSLWLPLRGRFLLIKTNRDDPTNVRQRTDLFRLLLFVCGICPRKKTRELKYASFNNVHPPTPQQSDRSFVSIDCHRPIWPRLLSFSDSCIFKTKSGRFWRTRSSYDMMWLVGGSSAGNLFEREIPVTAPRLRTTLSSRWIWLFIKI